MTVVIQRPIDWLGIGGGDRLIGAIAQLAIAQYMIF